jgi:hypothetical protein
MTVSNLDLKHVADRLDLSFGLTMAVTVEDFHGDPCDKQS